jgi:ATP-dependent DNA helicase RecQ
LPSLGRANWPCFGRKLAENPTRPGRVEYHPEHPFWSMTVDPDEHQAESLLRTRFGLGAFKPGQREVIRALLQFGAAVAVFPTGGGKSLCYQLPALLFEGVTLVVSPLIALMKDQIDYLRRRGINAARLDSSLDTAELRTVSEQLRSSQLTLLYVAPERFNNERFLEDLRRWRIALFAVDEAHCISEWGHNFRPDYLKLAEIARDLGVERVLALTATATPAVVQDICAAFGIPSQCAVVTGFHRPNLGLHTTPVGRADRDVLLLDRLRTRPPGSTIVYVTLQKTAEQVAERLASAGLPARAYHAGLDTPSRTAVQDWWTASDRAIVVATIAFGMGIDKANVRYVYHYNLPKSLESYSQEIGRAGRDGAPSTVELLACAADVPTLENFTYGDTPTSVALQSVVGELTSAGAAFEVSVADLSARHDIRPLVMRTILTYLELLGVLRQGTPLYAAYEAKPLQPIQSILARLEGEPRRFVERMFAAAKKGRIWYSFDPAAVARRLGADRERVVRALHFLDERGSIELRASEPRLRFTRASDSPLDLDALVATLLERFERREAQEIARVQQVLALVAEPGCQTAALVGYFGETLPGPCGHCTTCLSSADGAASPRRSLPVEAPLPPIASRLDRHAFDQVRQAHPAALGHPRQQARFLCGLSSPALTAARLSRHALFGVLEEYPFADVLAWCGGSVTAAGARSELAGPPGIRR